LVNPTAGQALARTAQLVADDVFGTSTADHADVAVAIVEGLQGTTVRLVADEANLASASGQTALMTTFGQLAMLGLAIELVMPEVELVSPQPPLRMTGLRAALLDYGNDLIPHARIGTELNDSALTIVFGSTPYRDPEALRVTGDPWRCTLARNGASPATLWMGTWPIGALAAGPVVAAEGLRAALPSISKGLDLPLPSEQRFRIDLDRAVHLDLSADINIKAPIDIGPIDFISGGALTFSALFCLTRVPRIRGNSRVIEPESLDITNLNRYALARRSDVLRSKSEILRAAASADMTVTGVSARFDREHEATIGPLRDRVLVGVDDIPSRWAVQAVKPRWLCVAGTSHFFGMVTTHGPGTACAGCAHPRDEPLDGPIPTVSFVSFFTGLLQARALLLNAIGQERPGSILQAWPFGLYGDHELLSGNLAPRRDCPIDCARSRSAA
jgi:hypothetical protein